MIKKILFTGCTIILMTACSSDQIPTEDIEGIKIANAILPQIEIVNSEPTTRINTELEIVNGFYNPIYKYQGNEEIVVFPSEGRALDWHIHEITSDGLHASFITEAWALREGATYTAFLPYSYEVINNGSNKAVAIDYTGQTVPKAYAKGETIDYLSEYDFQYALPITPANGKATFIFSRINAMLYLKVPYQNAGEQYTKLEIVLPEGSTEFTLKGSVNLLSGTVTATETSKTFSIKLDNVYGAVNSKGNLTGCYVGMWISPIKLPAGTTVKLYGNVSTTSFVFNEAVELQKNSFTYKALK